MAGNLIFDEIPVDRLEPAVLLEIKPNYSQTGLLPMPIKNLVIGPRLATGTLKAGEVAEISRPDEAAVFLGRGSIGAGMARRFREVNLSQPLYVLGVDDEASGVAAKGSISFAGSVSQSVTLRFLIDGVQVRILAAAGATANALATSLTGAVNAMLDLPVTAAASGGAVTLTCRHKGEIGNEIDLRLYERAQPLPSGLSVTIAPMAGGSGNPDLQTALDVIATIWFTTIVQPFNDASNMTAFAAFLKAQFLATSKLDALGFTFKSGTYAEVSAFGQSTNCAQLVCGGLKGSPTALLEGAIVTPRIMMTVWAGRCQLYGANSWIDDVETCVKQSFFQIAPNDKNRLESKQIIDIMGNLMVLAGSLEFKANS